MGNVVNTPLVSNDGESAAANDQEWLNLQSSACFNAQYVSSVYNTLPKYEGTETDDKAATDDSESTDSKTEHVLSLFSKKRFGGISVDDFKVQLQ